MNIEFNIDEVSTEQVRVCLGTTLYLRIDI